MSVGLSQIILYNSVISVLVVINTPDHRSEGDARHYVWQNMAEYGRIWKNITEYGRI